MFFPVVWSRGLLMGRGNGGVRVLKRVGRWRMVFRQGCGAGLCACLCPLGIEKGCSLGGTLTLLFTRFLSRWLAYFTITFLPFTM